MSTRSSLPEAVGYVRDLLREFDRPWFLCGGWAVDGWLGRQTREHGDVDIAVFQRDQHALFEHFAGWALVGHDPNVPGDTSQPWNGRHLDLPAHVHVPARDSPLATSTTVTHAAHEFEFLLNEGLDHQWILNPDLDVAVPVDGSIEESRWGLPTAAPEILLFFKAGGGLTGAELRAADTLFRPRDEQDFFALQPTLTPARRSWLRGSIGRIRPDHPWPAHLEA